MVKIGVIGLGYWGPNLVRNFSKVKDCEVVACADFDKERLETISEKYHQIKLYTDFQKLLKEVDAVVVATPLPSHFEIAQEALRSNKHVLLEKPFVSSVFQANELIKIANEKNLRLMVDHTFEYAASVRKIKQLLDKKSLGRVFNIDMVRVNLGLFQKHYNVIWDLAPHDISILMYLLGKKPTSVIALGDAFVNTKVEDSAHLYLKFPRHITATIYLSWLSPTKIRKITIIGSKKMLEYDDNLGKKIQLFDKGVSLEEDKNPKMPYYDTFQEFKYVYRQGDQKSVDIEEKEPLEVMSQEFIDSIMKEREPLTSGLEGRTVVEIIEAAQNSLQNGGKEVFISD